MFEKLSAAELRRPFSELEQEYGVVGEADDMPAGCLGPPAHEFYAQGEIDFAKTRKKFDRVARRLGIAVPAIASL